MPNSNTQDKMLGTLGSRSALRSITCLTNGDFSSLSVKASPSKRRFCPTRHQEGSQKRPKTQPPPLTYQLSEVSGAAKWNVIKEHPSEKIETELPVQSASLLSSYFSGDDRQSAMSFVRSELTDLLAKENEFHPNIDFLFKVDPDRENKVNAAMRDEAVFNLRFLHMYFQLSTLTFVQAVSLVDRFIVKVKVKPKYMACVATACYHIAAQEYEKECPKAEELVLFSRCGGTAADLLKMEQIIKSKPVGTDAVTILNFLQALIGNKKIPEKLMARLQVVLCSVRVHTYRPVTVAFALLSDYNRHFHDLHLPTNRRLKRLTRMCQITWAEVSECATYLHSSCESFYARSLPSSHRQMVWALSRRTLYNLSCSSPPGLNTISEDESDGTTGDDDESINTLLSSGIGSMDSVSEALMSVDEEDEEVTNADNFLSSANVMTKLDVEDEGETWLSRLFDENWIKERKNYRTSSTRATCLAS